jgi:TonB family protein
MSVNQTGIFYAQHAVDAAAIKAFPRELRSRLLSNIEPRFMLLFGGTFLLVGGIVFVLSFIKPSETISQKQIQKIQERYASIVLDQPKPAPKAEENGGNAAQEAAASKGGEKGGKVDRSKESLADRKARGAASSFARAARREAIGKQIAASGIFAAITAAGGSGGGYGGEGAADLLGAAGKAVGDLSGISVGNGAFVSAGSAGDGTGGSGSGGAAGYGPRGGRAGGADIQKAAIGKTSGAQLASAGEVSITTEAPPEVSGDAASSEERSMVAIQSIVNREKMRLVRVYENWLKRDPELKGTIKVKFTILPSGQVSNVSIVKSTMNNAEFEQNVVRYIQRWQFPPISGGGGGAAEVVVPFVFESSAQG